MSKGMSYTKVGASLDDLEEGDDDGSPLAMRRAAPCNGVPSASTSVCQRFATAGSLGGIRLLVLVGVVLQNTAYSLARRYSRGTLQEKYSASSALIVMELAKGALSCWKIAYSEAPSDVPAGPLLSKCAFLARHSMTMLVPAAIYLAMNILGFVALQYLDAATFAVLAQMKVLSTAVFSVLILQRRLHVRKWRALTLLTTGVVLLSHEAMPKKTDSTQGKAMSDFGVGVAAVGCEVLLSGFVSIYFEKVLKSKTEVYSVWDRNFQLAFWSILIYTPIMLHDRPGDPFGGWTPMAAACAAIGAAGGVLVALSIKYADSILKTIATSGAIVLTTALNAALLDGPWGLSIIAGAIVVVTAVFDYNDKGDPETRLSHAVDRLARNSASA
ncbi:hypothetical protein EMIHUDRAFT_96775 [Emiliania huxleyi CCMP1516]|uniref:Nucleotide-sugar transporter n=2 Tax=Emiliania huxleyi TaxID=2903 RepID=A0A0D3IE36_EMIH1|nr:hypothetical protein EMIHUDRAFT_96775 [Emiliania huxleyi CCMP1516]EOD09521.1 hypothetical protein EMIHUDRAFT_96775 [Emiliania huxleyi CCMP1516]|eukprot:XP_005761950.1 hypothetical protein EMIHUDRAFT_96775 [Emiliania huxleyi CCMP1516]